MAKRRLLIEQFILRQEAKSKEELSTLERTISKLSKSTDESIPHLLRHCVASQESILSLEGLKQLYVWMKSACVMTEEFLKIPLFPEEEDNTPLRLPNESIWIELEQPQITPKGHAAVFIFYRSENANTKKALQTICVEHLTLLRYQQTRDILNTYIYINASEAKNAKKEEYWNYAVFDKSGNVLWSFLYVYSLESTKGMWIASPWNYKCPQTLCQFVQAEGKGPGIGRYIFCDECYESFTYYTSWIKTALHMIAGDFQESEEAREREEVKETVTQMMRDPVKTWQTKEVKKTYHYRLVRYFDACVRKGTTTPQTVRGSWMSERPVTDDEYEVDPNAIIYIPIQPRDYDRTYRHERYTKMRGLTQHIEPGPRRQPITIAALQQRRRLKPTTHVIASLFEAEIE